MDRRSLGQQGEQAVADFLQARGYTVVARNARVGRLEIDLIARCGGLLAFCEVKTSHRGSIFGAQERLSQAQQQRLRRAAAQWLREHPDSAGAELRLDAAFVTLDAQGKPSIDYFEGAF